MRKTAFWSVTLLSALWLCVGSVIAQGGVRGVVVNDSANIRIVPAFGGQILAFVPSGFAFTANGRSPDNEWLRIDFNGSEAWLHTAPVVILQGDITALAVADPRTIPYGGFDSPRAGLTSASSSMRIRLVTGMHLRAGPSTGYPVLANPPRNSVIPVLGRTIGNNWVQVNFEGTLGWIAADGRFIELLDGTVIANLPVDGIVADSLPISEATATDYVATLKFMRDRVDLAQPSLDKVRGSWADAAIAGRVFCHEYPAQPSDYNIPNPLLAAYYPTLFPLQTKFNDAMFNVRHAIDLFIEACNQPGNGNPVGVATVQGALGVVNLADTQFADLRRTLNELIPPDRQPGPNECLLTFGGKSEILPVIQAGVIYYASFEVRKVAIGACFDPIGGRRYMFQALQTSGNARLLVSVSPLDNPTNFAGVGRDTTSAGSTTVGPLTITTVGRHLLIISDASALQRDEPLFSNFAYVFLDVTDLLLPPLLVLDPNTGQVVLQTAVPVITTTTVPGGPVPPGGTVCPSLAFTCGQLLTCQEAQACLAAGNFGLDADSDGIACEENLCLGP